MIVSQLSQRSLPLKIMEPIQPQTHSFIIKVWREESSDAPHTVCWRGQITHVPSGKRHYFTNLWAIPLFLVPFLQGLHTHVALSWQLLSWLYWQRKPKLGA